MVVDGLNVSRFSGLTPVFELWGTRYRTIPKEHGVYLVRGLPATAPAFRLKSEAGWFKGKDPSYPLAVVEQNWVKEASIVYIGKAGGASGLRQRVGQLIDFAYGKPIGHRGGRMLWHLADWKNLQIQWMVCQPGLADELESRLIEQFRQKYGSRPFANMVK